MKRTLTRLAIVMIATIALCAISASAWAAFDIKSKPQWAKYVGATTKADADSLQKKLHGLCGLGCEGNKDCEKACKATVDKAYPKVGDEGKTADKGKGDKGKGKDGDEKKPPKTRNPDPPTTEQPATPTALDELAKRVTALEVSNAEMKKMIEGILATPPVVASDTFGIPRTAWDIFIIILAILVIFLIYRLFQTNETLRRYGERLSKIPPDFENWFKNQVASIMTEVKKRPISIDVRNAMELQNMAGTIEAADKALTAAGQKKTRAENALKTLLDSHAKAENEVKAAKDAANAAKDGIIMAPMDNAEAQKAAREAFATANKAAIDTETAFNTFRTAFDENKAQLSKALEDAKKEEEQANTAIHSLRTRREELQKRLAPKRPAAPADEGEGDHDDPDAA